MNEVLEVDLSSVAQTIWAAMLGLELHPIRDPGGHHPDERVVTGVVQITGEWAGAVSVRTSERFAITAAATLFAMDANDVTTEEISDTIGELANVVGGNVKSALLGELQLSLPAVTSGRDYQIAISGTEVRDLLSFDCEGELVVVALHQRQPS